jgi:hypothetical protein
MDASPAQGDYEIVADQFDRLDLGANNGFQPPVNRPHIVIGAYSVGDGPWTRRRQPTVSVHRHRDPKTEFPIKPHVSLGDFITGQSGGELLEIDLFEPGRRLTSA